MIGIAKPLNISQPFLVSALLAEIARLLLFIKDGEQQ